MKRTHLTLNAVLAAMLAGGAFAQDTATTADPTAVPDGAVPGAEMTLPTFASLEEMTVGDMIGIQVYQPDGSRISEVDYVIDGAGGPEVILGIGGFLGLAEYTVAMPLSEFTLGEDGRSLRLDTDKETLKQHPEFDEANAQNLPSDTPVATLLAEVGAGGTSSTTEMTN